MKIKELVEKYTGVEKISNIIKIKRYISLNQKRMLARDAIDRNMDDVDGFITIDNIGADVSFVMNLIPLYTGLEVVDEIDDYDALCGSGIMTEILKAVEKDFDDARAILVAEREAVLAQNSIEAQVARVTDRLTSVINGLSGKFAEVIDGYDVSKIMPEGTNVDELLELIKKYK